MFRPYTIALFGHRQLANALQVEQRLEACLRELLRTHAQVEFLLGRNGEFDLLAASVIRRYGAQRVFFGTDYPMWSPEGELERFLRLPLTSAEQERILSCNLEDFLAERA